jgi:hypothetical protein
MKKLGVFLVVIILAMGIHIDAQNEQYNEQVSVVFDDSGSMAADVDGLMPITPYKPWLVY